MMNGTTTQGCGRTRARRGGAAAAVAAFTIGSAVSCVASPALAQGSRSDQMNASATAFFHALQVQANDQVGNQIGQSTLQAIQAGDAGDFPWFYENGNGDFNASTYDFINRVVVPGEAGTPTLSNKSFSAAYDDTLASISYELSRNDKAKLNKAILDNATVTNSLVQLYEQNVERISSDDMKRDKVKQKIDYVVNVISLDWSGFNRDPQKFDRFNFNIADVKSITKSLPFAPASGHPVIGAFSRWLQPMQASLPLVDATQRYTAALNSMMSAIENPEPGVNAIVVGDKHGVTRDLPGYVISSSITSIKNDLESKSRKIRVGMQLTDYSANSASMSINGGASVSVPLDFLTFRASSGASYNSSSFSSQSSAMDISISYEGYAYVPIAPMPYNRTTNEGWYDPSPIDEAANYSEDRSGYRFALDPGEKFGPNGSFGRLSGVLISNYPTISITYNHADYESIQKSFSTQNSFSIDLFGIIPLGGADQSSYNGSVSRGSEAGSVTITFSASDDVNGDNPIDQRATLIGGVVDYPGWSNEALPLRR